MLKLLISCWDDGVVEACPLRSPDGTLRRKQGTHYPSTLPIFRPWLDEKTVDCHMPSKFLIYNNNLSFKFQRHGRCAPCGGCTTGVKNRQHAHT